MTFSDANSYSRGGTDSGENSAEDARKMEERIKNELQFDRAKKLAASRIKYDEKHINQNLAGKIAPDNLKEMDCTTVMSNVAQKPLRSSAELFKLLEDNPDYIKDTTSEPGDWTLVQYKEKGKDQIFGHAQLNMRGGRYFDSTPTGGPRITEGHEVVEYLKKHSDVYEILKVEYLTPRK